MNIKFGMDNFYTRYLKRFLNSELHRSKNVLGSFEKSDLDDLIKYLSYPNTLTIFEVQKGLMLQFPELKTLFNVVLGDDKITWNAKCISQQASLYLEEHMAEIDEYCQSVGWEIDELQNWIDVNMDINSDGKIDELDRYILNDIVNNHNRSYSEDILRKADVNLDGFINQEDLEILDSYLVNHRLYLSVVSSGRQNIFPNEDMKIFINQFKGDFLYNYAIRDELGEGNDDVVHPVTTGTYKVGLFECKPRSKINNST